MKNYISKILIVFGVIILSLTFTSSASASLSVEDCLNPGWTTPIGCDQLLDSYYAGYYSDGYNYSHTNTQYAYSQPTQYSNVQPTTPIVNNYYYKTNTTTSTSKNKTTAATTVKSTATKSTATKSDTSTSTSTKTDTATKDGSDVFSSNQSNNNKLAALSFGVSNGFLPSSFWQWLLVIVLILAIVILIRLIDRSHRKSSQVVSVH